MFNWMVAEPHAITKFELMMADSNSWTQGHFAHGESGDELRRLPERTDEVTETIYRHPRSRRRNRCHPQLQRE